VLIRSGPSAKKWIFLVSALVFVQLTLTLCLPHSFALTVVGDILQNVALLAATVAILRNVVQGDNRSRFFWALMSLGFAAWLASQLMWTYFEIVLRKETPNPFAGDVILFLHIVPMMAALAVQPHVRAENHLTRLGTLDVLLLLIGWLYLYLFLVIPWQYVDPIESVYGHNFNMLYLSEHLVFLVGLVLVARHSSGPWKMIYKQLFGAAALYALGSIVAGAAIDAHVYYTGSFFDLPLIGAMSWFAVVGFAAPQLLRVEPEKTSATQHSVWPARLAMLAVISTPLMLAWAAFWSDTPHLVRIYRLELSIAVMLIMGILAFVKQQFQEGKLLQLLHESHHNLQEMVRLRDDLADKEQSLRWHSAELQRKNLELQEISYTDSLTGVWNRRFLEETLQADAGQVLRSYQRNEGSASSMGDHRDLVFMMVDIDFFKSVNDEYGHVVGDELLRKVAERLTRIMRKSDVLVRWGGEEFMIMSRAADRAGTAVFCSRILDMVASEPFQLSNTVRLQKTCSIGWAPYPWSESAYEALIADEVVELADYALYRAKGLGRNQCVGFLPSDAALASPGKITMANLRVPDSGLIKAVRTFGVVPANKDAEVQPSTDDVLSELSGDGFPRS
jgi:diguanylate cyclase (GGDEF)-like protein